MTITLFFEKKTNLSFFQVLVVEAKPILICVLMAKWFL
jgi:hypothetical protein